LVVENCYGYPSSFVYYCLYRDLSLEIQEELLAHNSETGESILWYGVYIMCDWTSRHLSYLPYSRQSELNAVGFFGMSVLDFLSQFPPSVAATLGFTDDQGLLRANTSQN